MSRSAAKHLKIDTRKLLIVFITIIAITAFQAYWLRDSYLREKKALEIRTNGLFMETARRVQDSLWQRRLTLVATDTLQKNDNKRPTITADGRTAKAAAIVLQRLASDSMQRPTEKKIGSFITIDKKNPDSNRLQVEDLRSIPAGEIKQIVIVNNQARDSLKVQTEVHRDRLMKITSRDGDGAPSINTLFFKDGEGRQFTILVDSLFNDSLSIPLLTKEFDKSLKADKLSIPFSIVSRPGDSAASFHLDDDRMMPRFPFGVFGKYQLNLGNTFPYLLRKISLPILFSVLLIGITVFSFVVLYRTLIKQQRLSAMKNEFMSNITHELKTPIATVGVAIEALRHFGASQNPERTKEYLDISTAELQRLSLLVDKVLKLSLFENKEVELRKENVDLLQLIHEVVDIMKLQFEKHHASVSIKKIGEDFSMDADRLHITSVIYNLLDNALKYGNGNPVIEIILSVLPNDILELRVNDNGIGIPKEYKWKVFDKFFRVPSGDTHNVKGYGLGLSYVSEIIKRHHGVIEVESELGEGASFIIKLPKKERSLVQLDNKRRILKESFAAPRSGNKK